MSLNDFLSLVTQLAYVLIAGTLSIDWARRRDRMSRDIALAFLALAVIIVIQSAQRLAGLQQPWLATLGSLALLAQPYLLLRVARYLRPIPALIQRGALLGLGLAWAALILIPAPLPAWAGILVAAFFVGSEAYAALVLIQGARATAGVTRKRLSLAAAGSGFLAATLLVAIVAVAIPEAARPVIALPTQVLALLSGLSYYLGFAPPRWLRQAWQLGELHDFLRQTTGRLAHDRAATFEQLSVAALRTAGGAAAVIARWDAAEQHLQIDRPGELPLRDLEMEPSAVGQAWRERRARAARVPADLGPETARWAEAIGAQALLIVPMLSLLRPWGLLIVALRYAPLFAADDLELLGLLAEQSAVALDYAALIEELRVINQSLEQRVAERTAELSRANTLLEAQAADLARANRALRTLSDCNQVLVRAESETGLLNQICQTIVETGGYRMAWVDYTEKDEGRSVRPVAQVGGDQDFVESPELSGDGTEHGRSPTGAAIRTGQPKVVQVAREAADGPWRERALQRGYAACIALPLMVGQSAFGGLGIFAAEPGAFDDAEVKLLVELANDLAYGITALRTRAAHAQAEEALRRSEELLRQTSRMAKVGGWELDLATMTPRWSEEMYRLHEVDPSVQPDLEGTINFYAPEARPVIAAAVEKAIAEGAPYDVELPFITATGKRLWVRAHGQAEFQDGRCRRLSGTFQDITERKQAAEALQASERRFRALVENSGMLINLINSEGALIYVSPAATRVIGHTPEEMVGRPAVEFLHPDEIDDPQRPFARMFRQPGVTLKAERRVRHKDGSWRWVEGYSTNLIDDPAVRALVFNYRDVTDRKQAEAAALRSQARLAGVIDSAMDAIVSVDANQRVVLFNAAAEQMFQCLSAEAIGQPLDRFVPERFRDAHRRHIRTFGETGVTSRRMGTLGDLRGRRADGDEFPIEVSISQIDDGAQKLFTAILRDVTQRQRLEGQLRELVANLERNNRELQDFAYVASHDLQEPLRKIMAFGDRLKAQSGAALDEKGRDYLARMQAAAGRMRTLIDDLLAFSRVTTKALPFTLVDLWRVANEVLSDLEIRLEKSGGRVEVGELPTIDADPTQMRQILQNLIGNALKFHKPDEPPVVKVSARLEGDACQIVVADNGIGFDEKYLDRIFTPFQRLHGRGEYEGTGIGLAVVRKIAERHGGSVTARSAPGQGATFVVILPVGHAGG